MATYLRPGVFIEETLLPLSNSTVSTSDSVAAFVGTSSKGGPLGPTLVTSWSQYMGLFGDDASETDDLGYAVFEFFNNGGSQCYVVRASNANATASSLTLLDLGDLAGESATAVDVLNVTAKAPGAWSSDTANGTAIYVTVSSANADGRFDLTVEVGQGATLVARENFVDLTLDPNDDRNALSIVNGSAGSAYVTLAMNAATSGKVFGTDYANPAALSATALGSTTNGVPGTDGVGSPDLSTAAKTLSQIPGNPNLDLNVPACGDHTILTDIISWAESVGNVFVVVDGPKPGPTDTPATMATALTTLEGGLPATSFAGVYGPWLYVQDRKVAGALRLTAPGGAVLGQYARSDVTRGVQKAPAGTSTTLRGVINVAANFDNTTLDTLNQKGVNVIRSVPGSGICIMGARTLDPGMPDRYINLRRAFMFLERDLTNLSQFAVFEDNDDTTYETVSEVLSQYLTTQWQVGVLKGATPDQAFFVVCDDTNNDATSQAAGVVNVQVGVALNSPAEFIVIQIGQYSAPSASTDTSS